MGRIAVGRHSVADHHDRLVIDPEPGVGLMVLGTAGLVQLMDRYAAHIGQTFLATKSGVRIWTAASVMLRRVDPIESVTPVSFITRRALPHWMSSSSTRQRAWRMSPSLVKVRRCLAALASASGSSLI